MRLASRLLAVFTLVLSSGSALRADLYYQTNLVSNISGMALNTDASLRNPWGISESATGPFWVSNQLSGNSTLYNSVGTKLALTVSVPFIPTAASTGPTGQVFNSTSDFILSNGNKANFIFADLSGTISAWNTGASAETKFNGSQGASYTGLALGTSALGSTLYAANNTTNTIETLNSAFIATALSGSFHDASLSSDMTAFNIQNLNGKLYVTYQSKTNAGGGAVDVFDLNGNLLNSLIANGPGGRLDSPWGVAIAPSTFGTYANALLVGNEDQGIINAFDVTNGSFLGTLRYFDNTPLTNLGLWGLQFGNGGNGGRKDTLYLTAGLAGEVNGLFASISAVPEPSSYLLLSLGAASMLLLKRRSRRPAQI